MERNVALRDGDAVNWLARSGWHVMRDARPLFLYGDAVRASGFELRRLWVSALTAVRPVRRTSSRSAELSLVIEGRGRIRAARFGEVSFETGSALLSDPSQPLTIETVAPAAFISLTTPRAHLAAGDGSEQLIASQAASSAGRVAFSNISTVILNSSVDPRSASFSYLRTAAESSASAFLVDDHDAPIIAGTSASRSLYRRAVALFAAHLANPDFGLADAAAELGVSASYVQLVFRQAGTTPLRHLQHTRALRAHDLITSLNATSAHDLTDIAQRTGFRSIRTMRDVIRRELNR
ncbi:helix-turn-helix domain-containing protein [Microbacteriaceae bacterium VKM Ac-2854]|nr:helix-turn-helix domain-containing protein [Microbacteriaceae bacterium VKM Ac-2854]